jgi:hypothetical protein
MSVVFTLVQSKQIIYMNETIQNTVQKIKDNVRNKYFTTSYTNAAIYFGLIS